MRAEVRRGTVRSVTFENVPAFAVHLDAALEIPELGQVTVDVAWGGMFYVIADADALGLRLVPEEGRVLARVGEMLKQELASFASLLKRRILSGEEEGLAAQEAPADLAEEGLPPDLGNELLEDEEGLEIKLAEAFEKLRQK